MFIRLPGTFYFNFAMESLPGLAAASSRQTEDEHKFFFWFIW